MKLLVVVFLLVSGRAFAEDFSIYPLTPGDLEFSSRLEPLFTPDRVYPPFPPVTTRATLEPYSMQYVYPSETTLYSMGFVEPDPNTEFSMYTPELTATVPEFEPELPNP